MPAVTAAILTVENKCASTQTQTKDGSRSKRDPRKSLVEISSFAETERDHEIE